MGAGNPALIPRTGDADISADVQSVPAPHQPGIRSRIADRHRAGPGQRRRCRSWSTTARSTPASGRSRARPRAQAERLDSYYSRARSLALITARNPSFRDFYEEPGGRADKIRAQGETVRNANRALAYLEQLFPGSIGEACFIDRRGAENARAVKGKVEPPSALSPDETGASFFDPTFALRPGEVYQSAPYVSPDTNEWVIANSTPVRVPGQAKPGDRPLRDHDREPAQPRGLVERPVRRRDPERAHRRRAGRQPVRRSAAASRVAHKHPNGVHLHPAVPLGRPDDERFKSLANTPAGAGTLDVGDKPAAFARVDRQAHNPNRWIVAAVSPTAAAAWYESLGVSEIAILIGALLLLGFGIVSLRSSQREVEGRRAARLAHRPAEPPQPDERPRAVHARRHPPSGRSCSRSSTWTASSRTTTRSAIRSATRCSSGWAPTCRTAVSAVGQRVPHGRRRVLRARARSTAAAPT